VLTLCGVSAPQEMRRDDAGLLEQSGAGDVTPR
jgi:hypothetical protein